MLDGKSPNLELMLADAPSSLCLSGLALAEPKFLYSSSLRFQLKLFSLHDDDATLPLDLDRLFDKLARIEEVSIVFFRARSFIIASVDSTKSLTVERSFTD